MKENHSPGEQHVFSSKKRPVTILLAITVILCSSLLFATGGKTYAASSAAGTVTPTASLPFTVSLATDPANASVSVNTPITLLASVTTSDSNETIAKVEFYTYYVASNTPTLIGTAQVAPYKITWTRSYPGGFPVMAKAYDTLGNVATSTQLTVTFFVPTTPSPPLTVTITSPANGSVYTLPAKIPFTAGISGVVGSNNFMFVIDFTATLLPNGPSSGGTVTQNDPRNFSITWVPPKAGTYSLMVTASFIDEAGEQYGASAPIRVQINAPSCTVSYQLQSQWAGGFNTNVVLTNTSSVPINGWMLAFTFPGDQKITNLWNGSYTQTGEQVSIVNVGYNSSIAPGGTVNFGFNGSWVSNDSSPTLFTLNGMACSTT